MANEYNAADIGEYLDREAIRDVLYRYSHAIDRCDAELLRSVYWPEAIDDHGIWVGKRDEYVAWVIPTLQSMLTVSQHFMGNILIRVDGKTAISETYFQAFHRCENADVKPAQDMVQGGRYIDRMEKRGKEWRILHRLVSFDYYREYADSGNWGEAKFMPAPRINGTRNPTDPTYELFSGSLMRAPFGT